MSCLLCERFELWSSFVWDDTRQFANLIIFEFDHFHLHYLLFMEFINAVLQLILYLFCTEAYIKVLFKVLIVLGCPKSSCRLKFKFSAFQFSFNIGTNFPDNPILTEHLILKLFHYTEKNIWLKMTKDFDYQSKFRLSQLEF